jgi:glycosyltransferase involved in cell wall biosynthesis
MKVCIVDIQKPREGSGSGIGEYTYHLAKGLKDKKDVEVSEFYAVPKVGRFDIKNLLYINTLFKAKLASLAKEDFDIIHITNHEIGFAAKILKQRGTKAKIITTIHDAIRLHGKHSASMLQRHYNRLVKGSMKDACRFSDMVLFNSTLTKMEVSRFFACKGGLVIPLGVKEDLMKTCIIKKKNNHFVVGYIGSFGFNKNVISILKVAKILKESSIMFNIYGNGQEYDKLLEFKYKNDLSNVEFKGFAPEDRLTEIYDSFSTLFFPSVYEGFGIPILEAQARGIPVIVFQKSLIPKETRKYCIDAKDEKDAASIILNLKIKGFGEKKKNAEIKYAREFTWEKFLQGTYSAYKRVLKS